MGSVLPLTFDEAAKHASPLEAHGHKDWRVPSKGELNVLFGNRAAVGGFDETGHIERGVVLVGLAQQRLYRVGSTLQGRAPAHHFQERPLSFALCAGMNLDD